MFSGIDFGCEVYSRSSLDRTARGNVSTRTAPRGDPQRVTTSRYTSHPEINSRKTSQIVTPCDQRAEARALADAINQVSSSRPGRRRRN